MTNLFLLLSFSTHSVEFTPLSDSSYYTYYKIEDSTVTQEQFKAFEDSLDRIKGSFRSKRAIDGGGVASHKMMDKFGGIYLVTIITEENHASYSIKRIKK